MGIFVCVVYLDREVYLATWMGWDGIALLCILCSCAFCLFVCFEQRESMVTYQPHRAATIVYLSILCIYVFCVFVLFVWC